MIKVNFWKSIVVLVICSFVAFPVYSQVGGISGSKLGAFCSDVVDHKHIEFEPAFYHVRAKKYWDGDGNLQNLYSTSDSARAETGMNFRFTYGLWDKLEIGTSISTDLSVSSWGARFVAYQNEKVGVAVIAGANIPFGNRDVDGKTRASQLMTAIGGGGVFSAQFTENLSLDFNAQYMFFMKETDNNSKGSWYANADIGYYFFQRQFQLIAGLGYQNSVFETYSNQILTVYPGVTIETGKRYIIVISTPFDVYGENALKNFGVSFALTIILD